MTTLKFLTIFLCLAQILSLSSAVLWCFQCSWEAGDKQGNNLTTCENQDLEEQKLGVPNQNPIMNPKCKGKHQPGLYNKEHGYNILKENCYPNACPTSGGLSGRCAQWIFYLDGGVVNMTFFCAISKETGCFTQPKEDGYILETCLCKDKDWCNAGDKMKATSLIIPIFICIVSHFL